jgi:CRP-like cAMP-binding protein
MVAPHVPIVVAGETPTAMYFIVSGLAKETGQGRGRGGAGNSTLGPGDMIAAEAVLNGSTNESTIFAHTPMRLLALSNQDVAMLLRKYPRLRRRIQRNTVQKTRRGRRREPVDDAAFGEEMEPKRSPLRAD